MLPRAPATVATLDDAGSGTVTGTKIGVPYAAQARWILVPAAVANTGAVVVVDAQGPGITVVPDSGLRRNSGVHGPPGRRADRRRPRG